MNEFWTTLNQELELLSERLRGSECPETLLPQDFEGWELSTRERLDGIVWRWICRQHSLDDLEPDLAWLLALRVLRAQKQVALMSLTQWPQSPTRSEALDWLLIANWACVVDEVVQAVMTPAAEDGTSPTRLPPWLR